MQQSGLADLLYAAAEWLAGPRGYAPDLLAVRVSLLVGVAIGVLRMTRPRAAFISTWAHETGHAVATLASGSGLGGMYVHRDGSGLVYSTSTSRITAVLVSIAGYSTPPILGLALGSLLRGGHLNFAIALVTGMALLVLPFQRNLLALALTVGMALMGFSSAYFAPGMSTAAIGLLSGLLLGSGLMDVCELHGHRRRHLSSYGGCASDVDNLEATTRVPALAWEGLLLVLAVTCVALTWQVWN